MPATILYLPIVSTPEIVGLPLGLTAWRGESINGVLAGWWFCDRGNEPLFFVAKGRSNALRFSVAARLCYEWEAATSSGADYQPLPLGCEAVGVDLATA